MMRLPWSKPDEPVQAPEQRSYTGIITNALESAVLSSTSGGQSAALETAAGYLAREMAAAEVEGPIWAQEAITPEWLAWTARQAIREGEAVSVIRMNADATSLLPTADHDWHGGGIDESSWTCRASISTPVGTDSRDYPRSALVVARWSLDARERYRGRGPATLAASTATLAKRAEDRLGDETQLPTAAFVTLPAGTTPGSDQTNPLQEAIGASRGKAHFVETTKGGRGDTHGAPIRDWSPTRLKPEPDSALVEAARDGFNRMLVAIGLPAALADPKADGTSQREALRRARLNFTMPFAVLVERELSRQLAVPVQLKFDSYALDMVSRSQVVSKLTGAGVSIETAMSAVGLSDG